MSYAQNLLDHLKTHLALPWPKNVSGQERVLMAVYPPNEERRIRRSIDSGEFAAEIRTLHHGWTSLDLSTAFSQWLAAHEYRDRLLQRPERLWDDKGNVKGLEEYLVARIAQAAPAVGRHGVAVPALRRAAGEHGDAARCGHRSLCIVWLDADFKAAAVGNQHLLFMQQVP